MTGKLVRKYRRYTAQERAQMVAECEAPGVSVSQVARRHDVNANLLFRWRREARETITSRPAADWLPVTVAPVATEACVQIDLGMVIVCVCRARCLMIWQSVVCGCCWDDSPAGDYAGVDCGSGLRPEPACVLENHSDNSWRKCWDSGC